jgi:hypothetical protein
LIQSSTEFIPSVVPSVSNEKESIKTVVDNDRINELKLENLSCNNNLMNLQSNLDLLK